MGISRNLRSTTENVAAFVWEGMSHLLQGIAELYEVRIHETDKNIVTFRGETCP